MKSCRGERDIRLEQSFTLLPSIFKTGVHPPSPHPKSSRWQKMYVGFEPKVRVNAWLTSDLLNQKDKQTNKQTDKQKTKQNEPNKQPKKWLMNFSESFTFKPNIYQLTHITVLNNCFERPWIVRWSILFLFSREEYSVDSPNFVSF